MTLQNDCQNPKNSLKKWEKPSMKKLPVKATYAGSGHTYETTPTGFATCPGGHVFSQYSGDCSS